MNLLRQQDDFDALGSTHRITTKLEMNDAKQANHLESCLCQVWASKISQPTEPLQSPTNHKQRLPRKVSLGSRAVGAAWCNLPSLEQLPVEPVLL